MTIAVYVLSFICAALIMYLAARWLYQKDEEAEDRKRAAIQLASKLESLGLKRIPAFLISYAVSDWSQCAMDLKHLAELFLSGETAVMEEFRLVFDRVLDVKLKSEDGRALLAAKLAEATKL
jgi:hypothetical protein